MSYQRHRNVRDAGWNRRSWTRGEKQLVVLAAVEREFQVDRLAPTANPSPRNVGGEDYGPHVRLFANVCEVGGKPVAEIDHGRSQPAPPQEIPNYDPRHGVEMAREILRLRLFPGEEFLEGRGTAAQFPRHIDSVPGLRARPQKGRPLRNRSQHYDVGQNVAGGLGRISTG